MLVVDGDGESINVLVARHAPEVARAVGVGETLLRLTEVLGVTWGLEANEVRTGDAVEQLLSPRQPREQVGRWERDVQEEPDAKVRPALTHERRDELQVVVVNPHGCVRRRGSGDRISEPRVHAVVVVPPGSVIHGLSDHIVVQRPQRCVREAVVVAAQVSGVEGDRLQVVPEILREANRLPAAGPPNPDAPAIDERVVQRVGQASR